MSCGRSPGDVAQNATPKTCPQFCCTRCVVSIALAPPLWLVAQCLGSGSIRAAHLVRRIRSFATRPGLATVWTDERSAGTSGITSQSISRKRRTPRRGDGDAMKVVGILGSPSIASRSASQRPQPVPRQGEGDHRRSGRFGSRCRDAAGPRRHLRHHETSTSSGAEPLGRAYRSTVSALKAPSALSKRAKAGVPGHVRSRRRPVRVTCDRRRQNCRRVAAPCSSLRPRDYIATSQVFSAVRCDAHIGVSVRRDLVAGTPRLKCPNSTHRQRGHVRVIAVLSANTGLAPVLVF